jgi:F-type H+-transporting ATPase subunit gamma
MSNLNKIKVRISSIKKIRKITQTMKMVSAAKFKKGTRFLTAAQAYKESLAKIFESFSLRFDVDSEKLPIYFKKRPLKRQAMIVIAGERGLCCGFNNSVLKSAVNFLEKQEDNVDIYLCGKKAALYFKKQKWEIKKTYGSDPINWSLDAVLEEFGPLLTQYENNEIDVVWLLANNMTTAFSATMPAKQILPITLPAKKEELEEDSGFTDFIYEPNEQGVLRNLMLRHLTFSLYLALRESKASEEKTRMITMDSATSNAKDVMNNLTLLYNRTRQALITKEISEIVAGAEALSE